MFSNNFKDSNLIERLSAEAHLTDDAWAFIDACTDDWFVDEVEDQDSKMFYEIRYQLHGFYNGHETAVTEIHYGNLDGVASLIEHLAFVESLLIKANGFGCDYE